MRHWTTATVIGVFCAATSADGLAANFYTGRPLQVVKVCSSDATISAATLTVEQDRSSRPFKLDFEAIDAPTRWQTIGQSTYAYFEVISGAPGACFQSVDGLEAFYASIKAQIAEDATVQHAIYRSFRHYDDGGNLDLYVGICFEPAGCVYWATSDLLSE